MRPFLFLCGGSSRRRTGLRARSALCRSFAPLCGGSFAPPFGVFAAPGCSGAGACPAVTAACALPGALLRRRIAAFCPFVGTFPGLLRPFCPFGRSSPGACFTALRRSRGEKTAPPFAPLCPPQTAPLPENFRKKKNRRLSPPVLFRCMGFVI